MRLRQELDEAFPDPLGPLPQTKLASLPWLEAIIDETLRLGLHAYLPRIVPEGGIVLDSHFIPEGTNVALAMYSQQRSPENFYPYPEVSGLLLFFTRAATNLAPQNFRPERWLAEGLGPETRTNKAALQSFSSGT